MQKYFYLTITLIFSLNFLFGQDSTNTKSQKHKTLCYYTFGLKAYGGCDEKCEKEISLKYGFVNKEKAGCLIRPGQARRWNRHNEKISKKLQKRNGTNWWDKYHDEINSCCKK